MLSGLEWNGMDWIGLGETGDVNGSLACREE